MRLDSETAVVLAELLESLPLAKIVTDGEGVVRYANTAAEKILRAADDILIESDRLSAKEPAQRRALLGGIGRMARKSRSQSGTAVALSLSGDHESPPLEVLIEPLSIALPEVVRESLGPLVIVTLAKRTLEHELDRAVICELYGLTDAECRLCEALANGYALDELTGRFGVSKNTLRSQLQSVFSKTGTARQTQLVRLLLTGVAMRNGRAKGADSGASGPSRGAAKGPGERS